MTTTPCGKNHIVSMPKKLMAKQNHPVLEIGEHLNTGLEELKSMHLG